MRTWVEMIDDLEMLAKELQDKWAEEMKARGLVPSRAKGEWIETIDSLGGNLTRRAYECSCCRLDLPYKTKFCPDCGADMR